MVTRSVLSRQGAMGLLSIVLALLGLLFFWVEPVGVVLSAAGIVVGVIGIAANYATGGRPLHQAANGLLLSVITLVITLSIPLILRGDLPSRIEPQRQALPTPTD